MTKKKLFVNKDSQKILIILWQLRKIKKAKTTATKLSNSGKFFILVMSHFFLIPKLKEF